MTKIPPSHQPPINQQDNIFHSIFITTNNCDWYQFTRRLVLICSTKGYELHRDSLPFAPQSVTIRIIFRHTWGRKQTFSIFKSIIPPFPMGNN